MALLPAMTAWAEVGDEFTKNNLKYKVTSENPNTVELVGYKSQPSGALEIPASVVNGDNDYEVTSIGNSAFGATSLTSVKIPSGVTTISQWAFEYCTNLKSVIFAERSQLTILNKGAFDTCSSLMSINIPEGVTSIGDYAFNSCRSLTSINIPSSVTSIGGLAFAQTNLTSINIPSSVTSIGGQAFTSCSNLISVTFAEGSQLTNIGQSAFRYCSNLTSISIPEGVKSINDHAFSDCSNLTSFTIPKYVTSIDKAAFARCSNLASITIPESVTYIGEWAFLDCSCLASITIPKGVRWINNYAFDGCKSMEDVYCYADPTILTWSGADNSFKNNKATICHVADVDAWTEKFANVNVTFVGDLSTDINALSPAIIEGKRAVYNLAGQRIGGMAKGLNIVDGRKVMVK